MCCFYSRVTMWCILLRSVFLVEQSHCCKRFASLAVFPCPSRRPHAVASCCSETRLCVATSLGIRMHFRWKYQLEDSRLKCRNCLLLSVKIFHHCDPLTGNEVYLNRTQAINGSSSEESSSVDKVTSSQGIPYLSLARKTFTDYSEQTKSMRWEFNGAGSF